MKDTKNYFPLQEIGYKGEYCITDLQIPAERRSHSEMNGMYIPT